MLSSAARIEEALDARRRVLGALALVAVRQQQHEAVVLVPLVLGGDEVLVDDDLGAVDEVAELRLPHHQRVACWRARSRTRTRVPAYSDSSESYTQKLASAPSSSSSGIHGSPVS